MSRNIGQLVDAITEAFALSLKGQRWEPRFDGSNWLTFCNEATNYVCRKMGYSGFDKPDSPHAFDAVLANQMVQKMRMGPDWKEIEAAEAQDFANRGALVVAGLASEGGHGHVCVVRPGSAEWSGSWQALSPKVLNVGKENFLDKKASFAFRSPPKFFVLREML
jgi:hypothetical protein